MDERTQQTEQQPVHQVLVDGQVIYTGDDWPEVFLEASQNPKFGIVVHLENGKPGAAWGPILHPEARQQTPF